MEAEAEAEKERSLKKKTNSRLDNQPDSTASLFTDDLILEILSRLPARSLHRFKCVSVSWRDLIADPANRNKLPQTLAGFLYMTFSNNRIHHNFASVYGAAAPFDPYLHNDKCRDMEQVDACNGLLLYRGYKKNKVDPWAKGYFRFVVCNPATGRWVELPPQPQPPKNEYACTVGLAFDPAVSSHFHVLYFEQTIREFYITAVNIYSSQAGAWSCRDSGMVEKVTPSFTDRCVFVGGMMYLMGIHEGIDKKKVVVGVDIEAKVWKIIPLPYSSRVGTIGSSQGCLHYAVPLVDNNGVLVSEIALWCLKDHDSKELVLKYTASVVKLMSISKKKYWVVEIHPDCNTIFLVSSGGDTLVAYDMRHQKVGRIIHLEENIILPQQFLPYVPLFSESLTESLAESLADADGQ